MKKVILSVFVLLIVGFLMYSFYSAVRDENVKEQENEQIVTNIDYLKEYLEDNYAGNFPVPEGDIILFNKNKEQIHLEDRNVALEDVEDLYIIQGDACNLPIDDASFISRTIHEKFSPKDTNGFKIKTCYKYAVTKDKKNYQIAYLERANNANYVTKFYGNTSDVMIRSYDSPHMIELNSDKYLPYYPGATKGPVVFVNELSSDTSLIADVNESTIKLKAGQNLLMDEDTMVPANISIQGNGVDSDDIELVYPDGTLVYIKPNESGLVDFQLEEYDPYKEELSMSLIAGKFLLNMVKYDDNKTVEVGNGQGTTMAIRGTLFSVDSSDDTFNTLLGMGKIKLYVGEEEQDIDIFSSFVNVDNITKKIRFDMTLLSELAGFMVMTDMSVYNPESNDDYILSSVDVKTPTDDVVLDDNGFEQIFKRSKVVDLSYKNKKSLELHVFDGDLATMVFEDRANPEPIRVKDIVIRYCESIGKKGGELTDLHYLLTFKTDEEGSNEFVLRDEILEKLGNSVENMKFFTINNTKKGQHSTRLTYKTKENTIESANFIDSKDIPTYVFMCKDE